MNTHITSIQDRLFNETRLPDARRGEAESAGRGYLVLDLEFRYDRGRHSGYRAAEGRGAEPMVRWPFHRISCASWMPLTYIPGENRMAFGEIQAISEREHDETAIISAVFDALKCRADAALVTWGGERKDLPALRRSAAEFGFVLPDTLLDLNPFSNSRIDLCHEVAGRAAFVHLPEYAYATGLPCKPAKSKDVGHFAENSDWANVEDQCRADVITTALVLLRHLASRGEIEMNMADAIGGLTEAASQAAPASHFVSKMLAPWATDQRARACVERAVSGASS